MAIRESHILKDAVKIAEIAVNSVGTEELVDGAATTPKIADAPNGATTAKINDGAVTTPKLADAPNGVTTVKINDLQVTNPKVADATLVYGKIAANEIQVTVDIPILVSITGGSVAADAVGTPAFAHTIFKLDTETIKHLKSANVCIDHAWAATADGKFQLYDVTAAAVRGESSANTGGETSSWESFSVSGLVAGNIHRIRVNITVAGAAGETVKLFRAILRLKLGVS